ncbi:MAG TPA: methyltransferase domain-containing protein [Acetobacteraceae bacterium]|nr:methyltransferase domain-containing protein [Acetobacteraceae bacterium]
MGEIFRRETAEHPEPFTGERLTTAIGGQVQIEHYHRYLFARSLVAGLDVLDVASGEGYGSALLAQVARTVVGVEYSGRTACGAAMNFRRPNLYFMRGDARALPLVDASVDVVVSFETIEHFDHQTDFVCEVHRVLRPGGCCIVSTPDRDVYSPAGAAANPFHVHELSGAEFVALLHTRFRHVSIVRQRAMIGSALLPDTIPEAPPLVFDRRGDTHFEACTGLPRAPYLVAVASDDEPPALPPSVYISRSDVDTDLLSAMALAKQVHETKAKLDETQAKLDDAQAKLDDTQTRLRDVTQRAEGAERERVEAEQRFALLRGSLRTFLRGYLPLLRAHLFGQRP